MLKYVEFLRIANRLTVKKVLYYCFFFKLLYFLKNRMVAARHQSWTRKSIGI